MLIRFHATTDTPGTLVESLTETEHVAIAEAHTPTFILFTDHDDGRSWTRWVRPVIRGSGQYPPRIHDSPHTPYLKQLI